MAEDGPDPGAWAEASRAHESTEAAQNALEAFHEEVAASRRKHGIASMVMVTMLVVDKGEPLAAWYARGDSDAWEPLAAVGMREARRQRADQLAEVAGLKERESSPFTREQRRLAAMHAAESQAWDRELERRAAEGEPPNTRADAVGEPGTEEPRE